MNEHYTEFEMRSMKAEQLRKNNINPYPAKATRTKTVADFLAAFDALMETNAAETLTGRIMLEREHGKLMFYRLLDGSGQVQLVLSKNEIGEAAFDFLAEYVDVGDIVQVTGTPFITKKGEPSLLITDCKLLSKALSPLPDKWHGIRDEEVRHRKRYLDILMNPELKELFHRKSRFWNATRSFLIQEGFLEVETPVLENTTGGADAQPFVTHHNALDIDVYLRISMGELWQKRLMVAGFDKTFEIGRQFRNEGMSPEHLQDYSQMEMYWAYADYEAGMDFIERMYRYIIMETLGEEQFTSKGFDIDVSQRWPHLDYTTAIQEQLGVHVLDASIEELEVACQKLGLDVEVHPNRGRLIDMLWKQCRKNIAGPVFLINHPVEVSPLAKRRVADPRTVERFQVIMAGSELGNGYSELNDPVDQRGRFEEQARLRAAGDTEAQMNDEEFIEALEYAMPPTFGFGFSERLFSFIVDKPIKECVMFPLLRPKHQVDETEQVNDSQGESTTSRAVSTEKTEITEPGISVEQAEVLLHEHITGDQLRKHSKSVGWQMEALAKKLGVVNTEAWYIAGLLHDVDYEQEGITAETHGHSGAELLREKGVHTDIVQAVEKHNPLNGAGQPTTLLERALYSLEQLTGLILACIAVRPDKDILGVEVKSVKKKLKDKSFAAGVDRTNIAKCEEWIGLTLDEAIETTLHAMKEHKTDIGL